MTRTISLIIGIAVVALVAVPTAFGEGRLAGSPEPDGVAFFYANERATMTSESSPPPVSENTPESAAVRAERLRSEGLNRKYGLGDFGTAVNYKDANERVDLPTAPDSAPVATTGREVEWPQIGIGFGIGIALAIVLGLSLKATRPRTLAH